MLDSHFTEINAGESSGHVLSRKKNGFTYYGCISTHCKAKLITQLIVLFNFGSYIYYIIMKLCLFVENVINNHLRLGQQC